MTLDEFAKLIDGLTADEMAAILQRSAALIVVEDARAAYERAQVAEQQRSQEAQLEIAALEAAYIAADKAAKGIG